MQHTAPGDLLGPAIAAAFDAGRAILEVYAGTIAVELKDDRSPLTEADRRAHQAIVSALSATDERTSGVRPGSPGSIGPVSASTVRSCHRAAPPAGDHVVARLWPPLISASRRRPDATLHRCQS